MNDGRFRVAIMMFLACSAFHLSGCATRQPPATPPSPPQTGQAAESPAAGGSSASTQSNPATRDSSAPPSDADPQSETGSRSEASTANDAAAPDAGTPAAQTTETTPGAGSAGAAGQVAEPATDGGAASSGTTGAVGGMGGSQPGSASTPQERQGELEGQLDESLRKFDEMLLQEQQVLAGRREKSGDNPQGSAAGAGGEPGGGASAGGAADGSRSTGEGADGAANAGGAPEAGASQSGGAAGGANAGSRGAITPSGIPEGGDDDIVARQLREAAQAEKDPALKRKLWEEYCAYKESTSGKRCADGWASSPGSGESR